MARKREKAPSRFMRILHYAYTFLGLVLYQDALTSPARFLRGAPKLQSGETEISNTLGQLIILGGVAVFLWKYRHDLAKSLHLLFPIFAVLALCFLSTIWSVYPAMTIRRAVTLSACVFFGIYCYYEFGLAKTVELMAKTTAVLAVLSLLAYYFMPSIGRETAQNYENALKGMYSQKNSIGAAMLLASNYYLFAFFAKRKIGFLGAIGGLAVLVCLALSASATALIIFASLFVVHFRNFIRRFWRLRLVLTYGVSMVVLVLASALIAAPAELFGLVGRDLSFTGRVPLWQNVIHAIMAKPILGYGFAAFWNHDSALVQTIWKYTGWEAPDAHSGYLDALLQLGIVGLAACLWVWSRIVSLALKVSKRGGFPEIYWLVGFTIINVIVNIDEGPQPAADEFTLLLPIIILTLERWRRRPRPFKRRVPVGAGLVAAASK